ncbi:TonB family protein [Dyadobacter sp. CY323]|uniref:TonB family protein n=1 Tax=Dyadobacter sp. CY323 TaxID=2907302 RepID=UPI001F356461|nr:TonB family protein [Dyadobacter sp. CY323]MCE6988693.1 TonB family protein [Dyadobacter sp. CY323]
METLLYLVKINVFLTVFYLAYWLLFRNHTFFVWNRFYLLGSLILALILPSITFTETYRPEIAEEANAIPATQPATVSLPLQDQGIDWVTIILICYAIGAAIMFGRLVASFYKMFTVVKRGESFETGEYTLILLDKKQPGNSFAGSFSFFKWLIVSRDDYEHNPDVILRHEYVHVRQLHSLDIILVESFKVIFWINPVIWLYKNAMQAVHEFLADQNVSDRESYARFLVSYALNVPRSMVANHFFNSSLLKSRIHMIYKNRTPRRALGKYLLILPITALAVFLTAARERIAEQVPATATAQKQSRPALADNDPKPVQNETIDIHGTIIDENGRYVADAIVILAGSTRGFATDKEGKFELKEVPADGKLVVSHVNFKSAEIFIEKNKTTYGITLHKNTEVISGGELTRPKPGEKFTNYHAGNVTETTSAAYKVTEQKPQFPGGHEAMLGYLRENIKYPDAALKANVQGVVLVQFTVDVDGTLGDVVIIKSVGFGLDGESIRLVKKMPKWEPAIQNGKPIRSSQAIEINFDLEEAKSKKQQGYLNVQKSENLFTMDDLGKRFNKVFDFSAIEEVPKAAKSDTARTYSTNYRYSPYKIATPGFVTRPTNAVFPKYRTVMKYQKP